MGDSTRIQAFLSAARSASGAGSAADEHALVIAAKKIRLAVETGKELLPADWADLFPDDRIRELARTMLSEVNVMDLDFAATVIESARPADDHAAQTIAVSPEALQRKWHALMTSIPDEGLAANDGCGVVTSLELGRLVLQVSQGKGRVNFAHLPVAGGFRERFVAAARDAGRLGLIDDLPESYS